MLSNYADVIASMIMFELHQRCAIFSNYKKANLAEGVSADPKAGFAAQQLLLCNDI